MAGENCPRYNGGPCERYQKLKERVFTLDCPEEREISYEWLKCGMIRGDAEVQRINDTLSKMEAQGIE